MSFAPALLILLAEERIAPYGMDKITPRELFRLNTYWFGSAFMWNSLHLIVLPAILLHFVPDNQKNTVLGLLTFAGLVIAMAVQPLSGALSDRWVSRWGRRRPLISLGVGLDLIFLGVLAWAGGLFWLAAGYIGLQLTSNLAHGPAQGLLPDKVPPQRLGAASGLKNLMDMAGLIAAAVIMARLYDPDQVQQAGPWALIALLLVAGAAITVLGVSEVPSHGQSRLASAKPWSAGLRGALASNPSYSWLIASRFAFLLGLFEIQAFGQYFIRDVVAHPDPVRLTGDLAAVLTLTALAFALLGGWVGDRFGHRRTLLLASALGAPGCLLLLTARASGTLILYGGVVGAAIGLFLTSNWALANRLAPRQQAGLFLGLTNLATAGAGAAARLAGPLVDAVNNLWAGSYAGYGLLFVLAAAAMALSAGMLRKVDLDPPAAQESPLSPPSP